MRWLKAIIVLIWLTLPVAAGALLLMDHQAYLGASANQQQLCQDRLRWLGDYNRQVGFLANELDRLSTEDDLATWNIDMDDLNRRMYRDALRLGSAPLNLFPLTAVALIEAESSLTEIKTILEGVANDRAFLIRVETQIGELAYHINDLEISARYYKSIGAERIYILLQEELAIQEGSYNRQVRGRQSLLASMSRQMREAISLQEQTTAELTSVGRLMAEDEQQTYRSNLKRRLGKFNLREQLRNIVYGTPTDSSAWLHHRSGPRSHQT